MSFVYSEYFTALLLWEQTKVNVSNVEIIMCLLRMKYFDIGLCPQVCLLFLYLTCFYADLFSSGDKYHSSQFYFVDSQLSFILPKFYKSYPLFAL